MPAAKPGLWANIRNKRERIEKGSKERMRTPEEARKKGLTESVFKKIKKSKRPR